MKVSEKYEDSWYKVLKFKVTKEQLKFLAANFNRFLFVAISSQRFPLYFSHFSQVFLLHFWLLFRPFSVLAMANNEFPNKISSVSFWKLKWRKCLVYTRTAAKESCSNVFLNYVNFITRHSTHTLLAFPWSTAAPPDGKRIHPKFPSVVRKVKLKFFQVQKKKKYLHSIFGVCRATSLNLLQFLFTFFPLFLL